MFHLIDLARWRCIVTRQERREVAREAAKELLKNPPKHKKKYVWDIGALLLGNGMTLMITEVWPSMYWPGVLCVYLGAFSLARHLASDADILPKKPRLRKIAVTITFFFICGFWSLKIVFVPAPLKQYSSAWIGNYPAGTFIGSIPWDSAHYVDVRVDLSNPSDHDYKDVDLFFAEDITIFGAAQLTQIPGISFFAEDSRSPFSSAQLEGKDGAGNPITIPMPIPLDVSRPTGFRLVCDKFPKHSTIKIVLVSSALNYGPPPLPKELFTPKRLPRHIKITGSYRAVGREREISESQNF